jgi:hypothetical protein
MTDADSSAPDFTLDELSERIETWRQTRKKRRPMPEYLWQTAASLSKKLSIQQVSKGFWHNAPKRGIPESCGFPKIAIYDSL